MTEKSYSNYYFHRNQRAWRLLQNYFVAVCPEERESTLEEMKRLFLSNLRRSVRREPKDSQED
jgi:hypothetical protein